MTFYKIDFVPGIGEVNVKTFNLKEISVKEACRLNEKWHSRLPIIKESNVIRNTHYICYGAFYGGECFGVAILSSPVSPSFNGLPIIELRRLAIPETAPKNTASWILGKVVKRIKLDIPEIEKIISYQDTEVHTGTIYKAANWKPAIKTKFADWNHGTRKRNAPQSKADKIRWEVVIGHKSNRPHKKAQEQGKIGTWF